MTKRTSRLCWILASTVALGTAAACSNDDSSSSDDATGGGAGETASGGEASESGGSNAGGAGSGGHASGGGDALGGAGGESASGGTSGSGGNGSGGNGSGGAAPVCAPLAESAKVWISEEPWMPVEGEPPPDGTPVPDRLGYMDLTAGLQSMTISAGKVGKAVQFDGDLSLWRNGTEAGGLFYFDTVEFWLKTTSTTAGLVHFNDCFNSCDGETSQIFSKVMYDLRVVDGKLAWNFRDQDGGGPEADGSQGVVGKTNVSDGKYHHIAAVIDKSDDTIALYVDGKLDLDSEPALDPYLKTWPPNEAVPQETGPLTVGARREVDNPQPAIQYLTGELDELTFYEGPLTASAIKQIYEADSAGKCIPE